MEKKKLSNIQVHPVSPCKCGGKVVEIDSMQCLTHCIPVDSSTVICWMSPFVILKVSGLFLPLLFYF